MVGITAPRERFLLLHMDFVDGSRLRVIEGDCAVVLLHYILCSLMLVG